MEKKDETVEIFGSTFPKWKDCPECKSKLSCEFSPVYYGYKPRCSKCQEKKDEISNTKTKNFNIIGKYKTVVAFGKDKKTGATIGITERGDYVRPEETAYDLKKDPHGWKSSGKRVREYDAHGQLNR